MEKSSRRNPAVGCLTFLLLAFTIFFVLPILLDVAKTFGRYGFPFTWLVPLLTWVGFTIAFLRIVAKLAKTVTSKTSSNQRDHGTDDQERGRTGDLEPQLPRSETVSVPPAGSTIAPDQATLRAFAKLGANPRMSYTQVSERYYELVKKVYASKMGEEERQARLKELEEAFEAVTRYYSEIY